MRYIEGFRYILVMFRGLIIIVDMIVVFVVEIVFFVMFIFFKGVLVMVVCFFSEFVIDCILLNSFN